VAEYPKRTLAVLLDDVAGFVFERGSILCHLAIILRERGVPAVILEDAREQLCQATQVYIDNSQVWTISESLSEKPPPRH
jgi:phosphoenolpyruvate-protein kinase (PTS system EI component)